MELDIQSDREIIKVVIADDQLTVRKSLQYQLATVNDIEIVAFAKNGIEALEKIAELDPDIIIIDLEMPYMDGITAIKEICSSFSNTKPLVLSTHQERDYINRAIVAGAKAYLLKGTSTEDLVNAIRNVYQGYFQLGSGLLEKVSISTSKVVANNKNIESKINGKSEEKVHDLIRKKIHVLEVNQVNTAKKFKKLEFKFYFLLYWQLVVTLIILFNV